MTALLRAWVLVFVATSALAQDVANWTRSSNPTSRTRPSWDRCWSPAAPAASILLLEERGRLKLDDPIKTYVPDAPLDSCRE
jgi:hypothetical protein